MEKKKVPKSKERILIIRFSAFGDICQSLFAAEKLKDSYRIDYVTRSDFHSFLEEFKDLNQVHSLDRKKGIRSLIQLGLQLRKENYDIVYDAHSNLRSHVISLLLTFGKKTSLIRRSKERLKFFLLFKFRKNKLPTPYRGGASYIQPIEPLIDPAQNDSPLNYNTSPIHPEAEKAKPYTLLAPFASWEQKMMPADQWVRFFKNNPEKSFVIVGGPQDQLPKEVTDQYSNQIIDLTGKAKWVPTLHLAHEAESIVGVDTGVTHIGDLIRKKSSFLIGPSAIGYPTRPTSQTLEVALPCKPCSKDGRKKCTNSIRLQCLSGIDMSQAEL